MKRFIVKYDKIGNRKVYSINEGVLFIKAADEVAGKAAVIEFFKSSDSDFIESDLVLEFIEIDEIKEEVKEISEYLY